jgi:biotin carboxyl carrier protein
MKYYVQVNGVEHVVELVERLGELLLSVDGQPLAMDFVEVDRLGQFAIIVKDRSYGVSIDGDEHTQALTIAGQQYIIEIEDERERAANAASRAGLGKGGTVKAVMPGVVVRVLVEEGARVEAGQPLLILEAMKMQNEIAATVAGTVSRLHVEAGRAVAAGERLIQIDP